MADETVPAATPSEVTAAQVAAVLDASPATTVVIPAAPVAPVAPTPVVDTDKLKALLITLGHDVEADWDHLVALVKKVF